MSNRKYPKVSGYWVYSIKIPSINKYYIGVSKQKCCIRWRKSAYKNTVIKHYFNEWQDMIKTVLVDNLSKEEAYQYEGKIIDALKMNDLCINEQRSGLITSDANAYRWELRKNNPEYHEKEKQRAKQYNLDNKENYQEYQREWHRQQRLKKKLEKQQQTSLQQ